jgi:calcineurin-like phosphoesterase family protein
VGGTFSTADRHFGHAAIVRYCGRPFTGVGEMDRAMVDSWNAAVRPEDVVHHLGDFALGPAARIEELLAVLSGYKVLFLGYHDRSARNHATMSATHRPTRAVG